MGDKTITVRVVEWTSLRQSNLVWEGPCVFGEAGGLHPVVEAAYSSFPRNCLNVSLVVAASSILLWANGAWVFSEAQMYGAIQTGYVVEVHVNAVRPLGPDVPHRHWVSDGPGAPGEHPLHGPGRAVGPTNARARRVRALLRQLKLL
jgi:hypothetical protein